MNGRSAGGLVLLVIGSLALIGYLTGNLDRWLGFLFTPAASSSTATSSGATGGNVVTLLPPGGNQRGTATA